jgi:hypothetical protein
MGYTAFCHACRLRPDDAESFEKFACVGGIPKYWEFVEAGQDAVALVESLYFDFAPYMEQEPQRILRDEGVTGLNAVAVLEAVGRGRLRRNSIQQEKTEMRCKERWLYSVTSRSRSPQAAPDKQGGRPQQNDVLVRRAI